MLVFLAAIIFSWRSGDISPANPYGAKTLEAQIPTPVPHENFAVLPVVTSDPYGYGVPDPYETADDAALAAGEGGDPTKMKVGAQ
jgi:cytochrome c oxidase subunit 1